MRLARLRHQMLIAMGLPACWTQASAPPPKEPPPQAPVYAPTRRDPPQIAMFDGKTCTIDTIVETVCGRGDGDYCDATAKKLQNAGERTESGLYVTTWDEARTELDAFALDDKASEAYVTRLLALNEKLEGRPACCYSRCTALVIGQAKPLPTPLPPQHLRNEACIPEPPKGTTQPDANNADCPQGVKIQNELRPYSGARNDQCCYASMHRRVIIHKGRPARVEGEPRFATLAHGTAWHANVAIDLSMSAATRAKLAASWLDAAKLEHASVAAFSMTSLRLMMFGAPPDLIAATHRAALDEIEHARVAFALASAYSDAPLSPAAFDAAVSAQPMELRDFAVETFVDGCIGETVAALEAERAAERAIDPVIADVLAQIAIDEAKHAELAWQIVAWCVRRDPALLDALRTALVDARPDFDDDGPGDDLAEHGVLGAADRRAAYDEVVHDVVTPCLDALAPSRAA